MTMLEGRPNQMSIQTVIAIVALIWTLLIGGLAYSFGQGGDSQRLVTVENDIKELQTNQVTLTALATRVVTLEGANAQLGKDIANGYARGLQREQQIGDMRDRVTKLEAGLEALINGQGRIENLLERKFGYQESRDATDLEQEFKRKP